MALEVTNKNTSASEKLGGGPAYPEVGRIYRSDLKACQRLFSGAGTPASEVLVKYDFTTYHGSHTPPRRERWLPMPDRLSFLSWINLSHGFRKVISSGKGNVLRGGLPSICL